jgi:hypothetical protein
VIELIEPLKPTNNKYTKRCHNLQYTHTKNKLKNTDSDINRFLIKANVRIDYKKTRRISKD